MAAPKKPNTIHVPPGHRLLYMVPVPVEMYEFIAEIGEAFRQRYPNNDAVQEYVREATEYAKCSVVTFNSLMEQTAYEIAKKYRFDPPPVQDPPQVALKAAARAAGEPLSDVSPPYRGMGSSNYKPRPMSKFQRRERSRKARERLGIPYGFKRVYDVDVPEALADRLKALVSARIQNNAGKNNGPLKCVPRDLAKAFTEDVLYALATGQNTSKGAILKIAKAVVQRNGRPWSLKSARE